MLVKSTNTLLFVLLFTLTGCFSMGFFAADPLKPDIPELYVGVTPTAVPLIYKDGGRVVGLEADLALAFGEYLQMVVLRILITVYR